MDELERRQRLQSLFEAHAAAVRAYALRRVDSSTADDAVSNVFVIACRRIEDIPADPLPWLLACARRVLSNHHRSARRQGALVDRLSAERFQAADWEPRPRTGLLRALAEIGPGDREVLLLVAWEDLTPERAAAALQCSRATFAVRLHRARRRLAAALERVDADDAFPTTSTEAV